MAEELKFIHASDFHLDQAMVGLPEIPAHLKNHIVDSPYHSAKRIFDLAIAEKVDFVLLSGDLFDLDAAGCRPPSFLLSQFERLAEKNISVYWCSGEVDHPDRWPAAVDLPGNVKTFSTNLIEEVVHMRRDRPIATIVASGFDSQRRTNADFIVDADSPFPIGLTHGSIETTAIATKNIRYWAIGGLHQHQSLERTAGQVVSAGTPQSRSPAEVGAHGCMLVRVEGSGVVRPQFIEVDSFRWLPQKMAVAENTTLDELKNLLGERSLKLVSDHPDRMLLVTWHFATTGPFHPQLRSSTNRRQLIEWLRREFGTGQTGVWSVDVSYDPPANLPEGWYEEDTILGDYLRAIGRYQNDDSMNLALHSYLPKHVDDDLANSTIRISAEQRQFILSAAALIGVEYLAAHRDWEDAAASSQT